MRFSVWWESYSLWCAHVENCMTLKLFKLNHQNVYGVPNQLFMAFPSTSNRKATLILNLKKNQRNSCKESDKMHFVFVRLVPLILFHNCLEWIILCRFQALTIDDGFTVSLNLPKHKSLNAHNRLLQHICINAMEKCLQDVRIILVSVLSHGTIVHQTWIKTIQQFQRLCN